MVDCALACAFKISGLGFTGTFSHFRPWSFATLIQIHTEFWFTLYFSLSESQVIGLLFN